MPAWIHARADHILSKNPEMPKSEAFALATQQSHALGKTPKGYGTDEGRRTAKAKYQSPGSMRKTADPQPSERKPVTAGRLILGGGSVGILGHRAGTFAAYRAGDAADAEARATGAKDFLHAVRGTAPVPVVEAPLMEGSAFSPGHVKPGWFRDAVEQGIGNVHASGGVVPGQVHPADPHIMLGSMRSPSVLAHEIGHAHLNESLLGRLAQGRTSQIALRASPLIAGAVGLATGGSDDDRGRLTGLTTGAALSLPALAAEAGASIKGYRNLKRLGASPEQLRLARRTLLPAFGTYAGLAGMAVGAGLLGTGIRRALKRKPAEGVSTEEMPPKVAFVDALPAIGGLVTGYGPGRNLAEETAHAVAPEGRRQRSGSIARELALVGAPLGGIAAMALGKKYNVAGHVADAVGRHFPTGLIAEPAAERELVMNAVPAVSAILGSMGGGAVTGGAVGGLQRLRGPLRTQPAPEPLDHQKMGMLMAVISKEAGLDQMRLHPKPVVPLSAKPPDQRFTVKTGEEAQLTDRPAPQKIPGAGGLAVKSLIGDTAAGLAAVGASRYSLGKAREEVQGLHSDAAADLYHKVEQASPVPVYEARSVPGGQFIPRNMPGAGVAHHMQGLGHLGETKIREPHILMGSGLKSPSFLAHEAGHAHIDRHALGRLVQNLPTIMAGKLSPAIGFAGGLATGGSEDEKTRNLGMASGLFASVPQLLYEAGASIKGYRDLKRLGASPQQLSAARHILLPAFGSYAAMSGKALAGGALGSAIGRAVHNSNVARREKEQAFQPKQATVNPVEKEDTQTGDEQSNDSGEEINAAEGQTDKRAFSTNQYSGVMNPPSMVYVSGQPGFREPPVKTAGPPSEKGAKVKTAIPGLTPLSRLNSSKLIGAPRSSAPPGPSIAEISKPKGYGHVLSGAGKGVNAI